ncbi:hypothetical protein [Paenibacillus xylanexedens]|uniref:hypothetical protein n=1 Tax=Paenibacillus xylanexedens TaxID=528191 RepID=UPI000F53FB49|nr:hypothetical protein [Paenibacillus xylanexedens]RPK31833.1 hypothetical protein EDO6_02460 [Paenibacillus xylanexedens]
MGSGKTSASIELMNKPDSNKYIYITPYLDEVTRIKQSCNERKFYEPKVFSLDGELYFKLDSLHKLLSEGKNIATTHELFKMATDVTKDLIYNGGYTLILDEALEVVKEVNISASDTKMLLKEWLIKSDNGALLWDTAKEDKQNEIYSGKFQLVRRYALNNNLAIHNGVILLWSFPPNVFELFKDTYILTYLFESQLQKYYFDIHSIKYEYWSVMNEKDRYFFVNKKSSSIRDIKNNIKSKIKIYDGSLNKVGEGKYSLSKSWYINKKHLHKQLKNNTLNYFNNIMNSRSDKNMWTTYKDFKGKISGVGYTKGYVSVNERSTNKYQNKIVLVYAVNRFLNPVLDGYFKSRDIEVNQDMYALSELIQWIWRSAIRNNEPINLYIPSERMRSILVSWLNDEISL